MNFISHFIALFIESAPWLILGFGIAGIINSLIPEDFLSRHLGGSGLLTTVKAAVIGAPLPLCSCGVVPAAIGLRKSGASKNATVAFLIATPETGVDSVSVTYALMGPVMAIIRPIAAIVSAIMAGVLVGKTDSLSDTNTDAGSQASSCCSRQDTPVIETSSCCSSSKPEETSSSDSCCGSQPMATTWQDKVFNGMRFSFEDLIDDIALWLLVGLLFAAAVLTWVPATFLSQWGSGWLAFLVMALIGVPMYICATASTPIAAGLLLAGVSPGAVLVFMLTGPATNIGTMFIIRQQLGKQALSAYLIGVVITSFSFGYLLNWMLAEFNWDIATQALINGESEPGWIANISAIVLAILIFKSIFKTTSQKFARQ